MPLVPIDQIAEHVVKETLRQIVNGQVKLKKKCIETDPEIEVDISMTVLLPNGLNAAPQITKASSGQTTDQGAQVTTETGKTDSTEKGDTEQTETGKTDQTESGATEQTETGKTDQTEKGSTTETPDLTDTTDQTVTEHQESKDDATQGFGRNNTVDFTYEE